MENIESVKSLLEEIQKRVFLTTSTLVRVDKNGKTVRVGCVAHDEKKIKEDPRYKTTKDWLYYKYIKEEYSRNYLIKEYNLKVSLSVFKKIFEIFEIPARCLGTVTNRTKSLRSEKSKKEYEKKTGWWDKKVFRVNKEYSGRGIQGYYFNKSLQKFVWLRSSYEYIYAKWLDNNNWEWDVEFKRYEVKDKIYRPDFFIFNNGVLKKIVEIKGYWNNTSWKVEELNKILKIDVAIINKEEIKNYTINVRKDIKEWKEIRLKKLELKK